MKIVNLESEHQKHATNALLHVIRTKTIEDKRQGELYVFMCDECGYVTGGYCTHSMLNWSESLMAQICDLCERKED